jgi:hypothetical protein
MFAGDKAEKVRQRAYLLFLERREGSQGDALSDWLAAEREILFEEKDSEYRGPARLAPHHPHYHTLTDSTGCDIENPA